MKWRRAGWQILLHLFLAFLIVASIILPAFHIEIPNVRAQDTSITELWVDGFDNSRTGWNRYGNSPYLDAQDQPDNYVEGDAENDEIGDFTFQDLDSGTVQNVTLKIYYYCYLYPPFAGAEVYLWNGSSWVYIDNFPETSNAGSWSWESYDVSDILDSLEKVNNAKIYFKAIGSYVSSYPIKVDAAYLSVELALQKFGKDTVGSNSYAWGGYNGKIFLTRFYCPQRASIIEGHVYMQPQNPSYIPAVKMVIYNSTFNDEPDRLVAESEPLIISNQLTWWNFTFNSVEISAGYYWIGLHINCSMLLDAVIVYYDDSEFELTYWKEDNFDDGPPDPFGTPDGKQSREYSIYVEYIPLAEPSPPDFTNKGKTISSQWWNVTFYAKWNDTDGLQCWKFMWRLTIEPLFPTVAWTEYGWYNWTGNPTQAWSNITLDLPLNGSVVVEWRFMARDVLGHITETPVETFVTPANDIFVFALNSTAIQKWGLKYPITFKFNITNANGQDIVVKKRYSENGDWITLPTKTSNDYFNGIECVRFNFTEGMAYVSVSFNGSSKLYIAFFNATTGDMLLEDTVKYAGKAKYYDNRKCAVTYTWDDWRDFFNATKLEQLQTRFVYVLNMCQTYQLYCSVGIVTNQTSPNAWSLLQTEINEGYVWAASHSRTHADLTNANYSTAIWEINGSRNDILGNLTLPYGEYVWLFIGPFGAVGQANDNVRQAISDSEYLIARSTAIEKDYADWYSEGGYYTIGVYKMLDSYKDDINTLKSFFDQGYENGYLMHFFGHPLEWNSTQLENLNDFLNYTHGKKDVWYAPVEYIYQYRYLCQFTTKWEIKLSPPNVVVNGTTDISVQPITFYAYWNHTRPLSRAEFYWNASGAWELNGTIEWTEDVIEAWTNFTRTIPSDVKRVGWYITCKDIFGVWGNTSLQILVIREWHILAYNFSLNVRKWSELTFSLSLDVMKWNLLSYSFNLYVLQWHILSYTFDLLTREWHSLTFLFQLVAMQWHQLLYIYDLTVYGWHQLTFPFTLDTMQWNKLLYDFVAQTRQWNMLGFPFTLLKWGEWHSLTYLFNLTVLQWHHTIYPFTLNTMQWNILNYTFQAITKMWHTLTFPFTLLPWIMWHRLIYQFEVFVPISVQPWYADPKLVSIFAFCLFLTAFMLKKLMLD